MYDHLAGEVIETRGTRAVLRTGGVGYALEVPTTTAARLAVGRPATLFTILHVLDGTPTLLGFAARAERELAARLLGVSGVGKAMTLAILSTYSPHEVAAAILRGDHVALKRIKGVGPKTAERLCLELRDHVGKLDLGEGAESRAELVPPAAEDAIAGLMTLGYSPKEARAKVEHAYRKAPEAGTEELIKVVLRG
jgi:Holliday junction DNA helicase RuvA